ncbi:glycosyltransferase [Methanocella arvoryzae]|uniref:Glucosyltransferase (Family 2) n=1 Tax=Methanocella arvoryzae (strain DSM 22066 / NBRC 105507 / MRE50) TaxID=351160 RepID=Q0W7G7_METAR|nr:glycosyltransferase [Methanocella arvoryzae]CAJ35676.1 glucosyltransferase (family 2) [Methanocella arvoryzae MRE50]
MQASQTQTTVHPEPEDSGKVRDIKVSVIIPTMNEPAISKVVNETRQALKHYVTEIIVVDKSTDDTPKKARKAGARVITQEQIGYGNAYLLGFRHVSPDADIVVMMDGDYTYDPYEIPLLIDPIVDGYADIVLGNRFGHMEEGAMNVRNRMGNGLITATINVLYKLRLRDSQSGFRAMSRTAMEMMEITSEGMPFASEMIIDARKKSIRIAEVPIRYRQRVGVPKLKAYKDGSLILGLVIRMVRDYNPLTIFLPIGGLLMLGGVIAWAFVVQEWLQTGIISRFASVVGGTMLFLAGLQIVFFGLLADIILVALRSRR